MSDFLATCEAGDFEPLVGETFVLTGGDGGFEITLRSVKRLQKTTQPDGASTEGREAFSLFFGGPAHPGFAYGSFLVSHPAIGEMFLMMNCVGTEAEERHYEALFA